MAVPVEITPARGWDGNSVVTAWESAPGVISRKERESAEQMAVPVEGQCGAADGERIRQGSCQLEGEGRASLLSLGARGGAGDATQSFHRQTIAPARQPACPEPRATQSNQVSRKKDHLQTSGVTAVTSEVRPVRMAPPLVRKGGQKMSITTDAGGAPADWEKCGPWLRWTTRQRAA